MDIKNINSRLKSIYEGAGGLGDTLITTVTAAKPKYQRGTKTASRNKNRKNTWDILTQLILFIRPGVARDIL